MSSVLQKTTWSITELSDEYGITPHTLRYYEKLGLLSASFRDASGRRRYSENDRIWLEYMLCFKRTGMSLEDLKTYIEMIHKGDGTASDRKALLERHKQKVEQHLKETMKSLELINYKIEVYSEIEADLKKLK